MSAPFRDAALRGCSVLAAVLVTQAAFAHGSRVRHSSQPAIHGVSVEPCPSDAEATCLHMIGTKLHDGGDPVVVLNDTQLEIHLLSDRGAGLFVAVPDDIEAGIHVVWVTNAWGSATQEVTLPGIGASSVPGYTTVRVRSPFQQGEANALAECPEGSVVTGGGYVLGVYDADVFINSPSGSGGWQVVAKSPSDSSIGDLTAFAVCIDPEAFGSNLVADQR